MDDELLAALRARVADPSTRVDVRVTPAVPLRPPATADMLASTEAKLGLTLYPFLKRVYLEVANGGFGPGYGLLSVNDSSREERSLPSVYHDFRAHGWPDKLLPLWDWGDAIWSCIDGDSPEGAIITHDDASGSTRTAFTIYTWLRSWVDGVDMWREIYEDQEATIINPFTKKAVVTKIRGRAKGVR